MRYTNEFKEAIAFATTKNLFLGYGNPNGKILIIGKEQYYKSLKNPDSDEYYKDLLKKRDEVNFQNTKSWVQNIEQEFQPDWDLKIGGFLDDSNALTAWWNQRNVPNRKLKNGEGNGGTSNTYLHYQKIYQDVFLNGKKQDHINFQKEFFITEMNDLLAEKDFSYRKLKSLKREFIEERQKLLSVPFFKTFPVIIIASGHYSKNFDFDIQKTFDVKYIGKTTEVGKYWYNLHYNENGKRLVIHTRQLSYGVSNELISELSREIKLFLEKGDL